MLHMWRAHVIRRARESANPRTRLQTTQNTNEGLPDMRADSRGPRTESRPALVRLVPGLVHEAMSCGRRCLVDGLPCILRGS
eukprot:202997-Prymnesium_polylepis.1